MPRGRQSGEPQIVRDTFRNYVNYYTINYDTT